LDIRDSVEPAAGVPLIVITPALVELAKRMGLPSRYAGLAAMLTATVLLACGDLALGGVPNDGLASAVARWLLGGVVHGLAAVGLYSQGQQMRERHLAGMDV